MTTGTTTTRFLEAELAEFEIVGVSIGGDRAKARNEVGQDCFAWTGENDWVVAVVSDGAGSATRATDGASFVCEEICRAIAASLMAGLVIEPGETPGLRGQAERAVGIGIDEARRRCAEAAQKEHQLADFHATVVGTIVRNGEGVLFHIGDGAASAHRIFKGMLETLSFSPPENGEYINETFFYTQDWWIEGREQHLRFTEIPHQASTVWLMTDGGYVLLVGRNESQVDDTAAREIDRLVFGAASGTRASVLGAILSSEDGDWNDDDKTLVMIKRRN